MSNFNKVISIVGIMGAGKSSLGKKIANHLKISFFDLDKRINEMSGYSVKEIYNFFGLNVLHAIEFYILQKMIETGSCVISTGDITVENEKAWSLIKNKTNMIWIDVDLKVLTNRLKINENRPFLVKNNFENKSNLLSYLNFLYSKRLDKYKESNIILKNNVFANKNKVLEEVMKLL